MRPLSNDCSPVWPVRNLQLLAASMVLVGCPDPATPPDAEPPPAQADLFLPMSDLRSEPVDAALPEPVDAALPELVDAAPPDLETLDANWTHPETRCVWPDGGEDPANCGGPGIACKQWEACALGLCVSTDEYNCGGPGIGCGIRQACVFGRCVDGSNVVLRGWSDVAGNYHTCPVLFDGRNLDPYNYRTLNPCERNGLLAAALLVSRSTAGYSVSTLTHNNPHTGGTTVTDPVLGTSILVDALDSGTYHSNTLTRHKAPEAAVLRRFAVCLDQAL